MTDEVSRFRRELLGGRYAIEKMLGQGGMGIVYLAYDMKVLSKPVVVKLLREDAVHRDYFDKKFRREIEALARIDHPGVVGILDVGETTEGLPYLVMQYVQGQTLRKIMNQGRMELNRASRILKQASQALNAAHERGIYHRDLKPENIMIQTVGDREEYVKIIDFGIAAVKGSQAEMTQTETSAMGTFSYMAPEQLEGKPKAASDIFALGVVAYEMLVGKKPFQANTVLQLYELHKTGPRETPRMLCPKLPQAVEILILKALAFRSQDRFEKATDFGEALERAVMFDSKMLSTGPPAPVPISFPAPIIQPRDPNLGLLVPKMCNRLRQVMEFTDFFMPRLKSRSGIPQVCVIHGEERECHDSFVDRLVGSQIKLAAERIWGAEKAAVTFRRFGWPYDGEMEMLKHELKRMLFAEFDPAYMEEDLSAEALADLAATWLSPLVVVQHRLYAARWNSLTAPLLRWYMSYLSGMRPGRNRPHFVVFLTVLYPKERDQWWKRYLQVSHFDRNEIAGQLSELVTHGNEGCACIMLSELLPLTPDEVKDWFAINNIHSEKSRLELLERLYRRPDGMPWERRSMMDIEYELARLIESLQPNILSTRSYA